MAGAGREGSWSRFPNPSIPTRPTSPRAGSTCCCFRLSSQQQALARIQSRAANLVLISLTMVGLHLGLLALIGDPLDTVTLVGVGILTALLAVTGGLFGLVFKPGTFATTPAPEAIIQRLWHEGSQAMWSWSHSLQDAIKENARGLDHDSRMTLYALTTVGIQLAVFIAFSITALAR